MKGDSWDFRLWLEMVVQTWGFISVAVEMAVEADAIPCTVFPSFMLRVEGTYCRTATSAEPGAILTIWPATRN